VTSGPIIQTNIDDQYEIGDIIQANGSTHQLNLQVLSSGKADDFLSYVIVYRNGEIFKLWDLRADKSRKFDESIELRETEKAWYVVKAYGSKAVEDPTSLDILSLCKKTSKSDFPDFSGDKHDVCITSPFYFRPTDEIDPEPLISNIDLKLIDPISGKTIQDAEIEVLVNGEKTNSYKIENGHLKFTMPIQGVILIKADGYPEIRRGLYLDYLPHRELIEELANGDWRINLKDGSLYNSGEVPWEAFNFEKTKNLLSEVDWKIEMKTNERDDQWEAFEKIFKVETHE
jgi:hypothetical protein